MPPGAVVTTDDYSPTEPVTSAETAIDRSMSAFWPVEVERSAGVTRTAIGQPALVAGSSQVVVPFSGSIHATIRNRWQTISVSSVRANNGSPSRCRRSSM